MQTYSQNKVVELADIPVGDAQGIIQAEADALEALVTTSVRNIMEKDFYLSLETCISHRGSETQVELLTTAIIANKPPPDSQGWEFILHN